MAKTISDYQNDWQTAYKSGDQKAMDAAHAGAEGIRNGGSVNNLNSGSVVTPVYTGASTQPNEQSMRSYLDTLGKGSLISWDPNAGVNGGAGLTTINGTQWGGGSGIPGTRWDPNTSQHYITNADEFLNAVNLGTDPRQSQIDALLAEQAQMNARMQAQIQSLMNTGFERVSGIGYDEGLKRASAALTPKYELSAKDVLAKLAGHQINRGFYGQLPGDVVTQDAVARLEAEKNAAIADQANSLVSQSNQEAYQNNSLSQQGFSNQLSTMLGLMDSSQRANSDRLTGLMSLLTNSQGQKNSDREYGLKLQDQTNVNKAQAMSDAMTRWQTSGVVNNQADANLLGVPMGTQTNDASYRDASLAIQRMQAANSGRTGNADEPTDYTEAIASMLGGVAGGTVKAEAAYNWANAMYNQDQISPDQYNMMMDILAPSQGTTAAPAASSSLLSLNGLMNRMKSAATTPQIQMRNAFSSMGGR